MLEKAGGYGIYGARQYEVQLRNRTLKHLQQLDHRAAERAWTAHISAAHAEETSKRVLDQSSSSLRNQSRNLGRSHLNGKSTRSQEGPSC